MLRHKKIPFKSSFILWKTLRGKYPTNEILTSFGIDPSHCFCCLDRAGMDIIEHTFNSAQFAAKVWNSFAGSAGVQLDNSSLQQLLQQWWTVKSKNAAHKLLQFSFTGIYGRTGVPASMEVKQQPSAGISMQSTKTTLKC